MPLTRRQLEILHLLQRLAAAGEPAPTLDGLCRHLGLRSRGSLHKHIQALVDAGHLVPCRGRHLGIRLRSAPLPLRQLPLLGRIAAGQPIEAIEDVEQIEVPEQLRTDRPCFVLRVAGDSMCDAGILDGDYVVIEQRAQARDGEIVVALIRGEEATLKRIVQRPDQVLLCPENSAMAAMAYRPDEVQVQGVLVGQMRRYR